MNYCIYETEHGIKTAKSSIHTTHGNDCMLAESALCFIIFFCYHKLCHQHWNLLNPWSRTRMKFATHSQPANTTELNFIKRRRSAAYNAFLFREMEFRFMDCDLKHFMTRLAFLGRKDYFATLWRTSDTFWMKNCTMFVSCEIPLHGAEKRGRSSTPLLLFALLFRTVHVQQNRNSHATSILSLAA